MYMLKASKSGLFHWLHYILNFHSLILNNSSRLAPSNIKRRRRISSLSINRFLIEYRIFMARWTPRQSLTLSRSG